MSRLWVEAWSWPPASTKIMDVPVVKHSATLRLSGVGDGHATLPAGFDRLAELINRDPDTPANDVRTVMRIFQDSGDPVYEWFPDVGGDLLTDQEDAGITLSGSGVESLLADAVLLPYDYPANPTVQRDWPYGSGQSIALRNGGFEDSEVSVDALQNGGFEDGSMNGWDNIVAGGDWRASDVPAVASTTQVRTGTYSAEIDPGTRHSGIRQTITVEAGERYQITAYLKEPTAAGKRYTLLCSVGSGYTQHSVGYVYNGYAITELDNVAPNPAHNGLPGGATDGTWQQFAADITVGTTQTTMDIRIIYDHHDASNGPVAYIDDVTVAGPGKGLEPWIPTGVPSTFEAEAVIVKEGVLSAKLVAANVWDGITQGSFTNLIVGKTYTYSVWVYTTDAAAQFTVAVAHTAGVVIASALIVPGAGVWAQAYVTFEVPDGATSLQFNVRYSGLGALPVTFYVDDAQLREGFQAATVGEILIAILDDATADHVGDGWQLIDYLDYTSFTAALDSNGDAWTADEAITLKEGKTYLQIMDHFVELGYEWEIRWDSGLSKYRLYVYNGSGIGTDYSAASTPTVLLGAGTIAGPVVHVQQRGNTILARGADGLYAVAEDTGSVGAVGGRAQYVVAQQVTEQATLDRLAAEAVAARLLKGLSVGIVLEPSDDQSVPLRDYTVGDTLTVGLPTIAGTVARRLNSLTFDVTGKVDRYEAKFESEVYQGQAAIAEGVRWLLAKFEGPTFEEELSTLEEEGDTIIPYAFPSVLVAASDAADRIKAVADFVCDGYSDQEEINAAYTYLADSTAIRGRLVLSAGHYNIDGQVVEVPYTLTVGMGERGTYIQVDGVAVTGIAWLIASYTTRRDFTITEVLS